MLEQLVHHEAAVVLEVDGLLILQASNCNQQIPAKLYEYVRARRPVLALTDPVGDTAATLRGAGLTSIARLDDAVSIAAAIPAFIAACSREGRAKTFASLLDRTIAT